MRSTRPSPDPPTASASPTPGERVESWKEIANYLKRDVRTVQRWEEREDLPVHRHMHGERGTVYAYKTDLDAWWNNRRPKIEAEEAAAKKAKKWPLVLAGTVAIVAVLAGLVAWQRDALVEKFPALEPLLGRPPYTAPTAEQLTAAGVRFWIPVQPIGESPGPRISASGVYDQSSHRMIVFGGYHAAFSNDVWVLQNARNAIERPEWIRLRTAGTAPQPRMFHSAVYDATSNRMVIFGGDDGRDSFSDVWVLTHANGLGGAPRWSELHPQGKLPALRSGHSAVYDSDSNRMIVYGGLSTSPGDSFSDLWVLEHANGLGGAPRWTLLQPHGSGPKERHNHTAVYDQASNRMIVYGGYTVPHWSLPAANKVWVLTKANGLAGTPEWTELSPKGAPPAARVRHVALYDANENSMFVVMGNEDDPTLSDVWMLTHANGLGGASEWRLLKSPDPQPLRRRRHVAALDISQSRLLVFGGQGVSSNLGDLWVLTHPGEVPDEFAESFDSPALDPAWQVSPGTGSISLIENPGYLRYRAAAGDGGPGMLVLYRAFRGDFWKLETRVSYYTGPSGGGRSLSLMIGLGALPSHLDRSWNGVAISRHRDDWTNSDLGEVFLRFSEIGITDRGSRETKLPLNRADSYVWRVERHGRTVRVELSDDGVTFRFVGSHTFAAPIDGALQFLQIDCPSFANFDSYADYDYIRLTKLPPTSPPR